jgi:hypothetical protein
VTTIERPLLAPPERIPAFDVSGWVLRIGAGAVFLGVGITNSTQVRIGCGSLRRLASATGFVI